MTWILPLLMTAALAGGLYAVKHRRGRLQQALQASFAARRFDTPAGRVGGSQLQVVMTRCQATRSPGNTPAELFWYCVGPGPCYYLAIATIGQRGLGFEVDWIVRPLTAERMRAALTGDQQALARAFGNQRTGTDRP